MMELVNMISTVGFPIVLCFYLVVKFEKTLDKNTEAINNICEIIKRR